MTFIKNRISHANYMELNRERFYKKAGRLASHSPLKNNWPKKQETIDISVIVRTKDRPILLKRALTSIANQTFNRFEIVLINDGGADISNIIDQLGLQIPITIIYNKSSLGRTAAINQGLNKCQGNYISFLDDDDIIYPWHLELLYQYILKVGVPFVYSDYNQALFMEASRGIPEKIVGAIPWDYQRSELLI